MTGLEIYTFVKFWMPLAAFFGLTIRAWRSSKRGITIWANSLLNNHLKHIQQATEDTALALNKMVDSNREVAGVLSQVAVDIKEQHIEDARIQTSILTGIEVIKAKID